MRDETFYILYMDDNSETSIYFGDIVFYTNNKILLDKFLLQYKDVAFDIHQIRGDNIIEVADEFNSMNNVTGNRILEKDSLLSLYTSASLPDISFISAPNYIERNIESYDQFLTYILKLLMSAYLNILKLLPCLKNNDELSNFLQFVYLYINRMVIALDCDIYSMPEDALIKLGLSKDECFTDILDENLIYYMQEFGWGDD